MKRNKKRVLIDTYLEPASRENLSYSLNAIKVEAEFTSS